MFFLVYLPSARRSCDTILVAPRSHIAAYGAHRGVPLRASQPVLRAGVMRLSSRQAPSCVLPPSGQLISTRLLVPTTV